MRHSLRPICAGIASTLVLFGVADLIARAFNPAAAPLLTLSQAIIPFTPPSMIKPVIELFGTNDKLVLVITTGIGALILGGLIGWLGGRHPRLGLLALIIAGLVPAIAILTRPGTGIVDVVPTLLGLLLGVVAFVFLLRLAGSGAGAHARTQAREGRGETSAADDEGTQARGDSDATTDRLGEEDPHDPPPDARIRLLSRASEDRPNTGSSRRRFFTVTGTAAALGTLAIVTGQTLASLTRDAASAVSRLVLPAPATPAPPIPAGATLDDEGITPFLTTQQDFYRIDTALAPPVIDPETWTLRIHGMVENEITLTMDDVLDLPLEEHHITLTCVSNPVGGSLVGTGTWLGYPLRELLRESKPEEGADMVLSHSFDGFSASTPLEVLQDDRDSLLAVGMNGEPLIPERGFPARLVVPGLYGFVSATKWVVELEVTRFDEQTAYWTDRGWDAKAPILPASRIDVPRPLAKLPAGTVVAGGTAWAQHHGVGKVEVKLDNGDWTEAELGDEVSIDTWRQWRTEFDDVESGLHAVTVRAIDRDGNVQTAERRESIPNSATGHHRIQFTVD